MLHTPLGANRLLASPERGCLWLLDSGTAAIWDLYVDGWSGESLVELLVECLGVTPSAACTYLDEVLAQWRDAGLLVDTEAHQYLPRMEILPSLPLPGATPVPQGAWRLCLADRVVHLAISNPGLYTVFESLLAPLVAPPLATEDSPSTLALPDDWLAVQGDAAHWTLIMNGVRLKAGQGYDAILMETLTILTELGCRTPERMLVVHGAGLVAPDGRSLLLIAPGGSGKSTLTAALNAVGYGVLSDDVVPVTMDGALLGLGLPLCLKAGSWPILAAYRPNLGQAPVVRRFGQAVRYLPSFGPAVTGPFKPARLLFTHFCPSQPPCCEPLSPEQVLQGLIKAEVIIRDLTQTKLEALATWVSATPAYHVTYPDLDSGLMLVQAILEMEVSPAQPITFT